MTSEEMQLLLMRGAIESLPDDQKVKTKELADRLREIVSSEKDIGPIALALVGAELSVKS